MSDPIFWLGLSVSLVAVSLTAVLIVAIPALTELARAARSAEKLCDTLNREFPPTLEAIRLTGSELRELTDEINDGVSHVSGLVKKVDRNLTQTQVQVSRLQRGSRRLVIGFKAAWYKWQRYPHQQKLASPMLPDED